MCDDNHKSVGSGIATAVGYICLTAIFIVWLLIDNDVIK